MNYANRTISGSFTWKKHKKVVMENLVRLNRGEPTDSPYTITEALNILMNSVIVDEPVDFTKTGRGATKMMDEILEKA